MPAATAETAVRDYLRALADPDSLRDDDAIEDLTNRLEKSDDALERLRIRQQLLDLQSPSIERYEEGFVTYAKAWADEQGIGAKAFTDEGVSNEVLRRAGFDVGPRGRRSRSRTAAPATRGPRSRVSSEEVRAAIPKSGTFTIKSLQDASGASPAIVRKVVSEEESAGRVRNDGTDPDHRGPGRAPVLYRRT